MTSRGQFITIEGGEGAGKSTNIAVVEQCLQQRGVPFMRTREPGGTPLAEEIRHLLLSPRAEPVAEKAELLLVFAARAQHLATVIEPALAAGQWVVCDRFTDATYAYQSGGRGLSERLIAQLEDLVQEGLQPDLTLLLDLDVGTGLARAGSRSAPDRFEQENAVFFDRVRAVYRQRAAAYPARFRLIDASLSLPEVQQSIETVMQDFLTRHGY